VTLTLTAAAEADIRDAHQWYKRRADKLGEQFKRSLDACFGRVAENPHSYPVVYSETRRALIRRFPYSVFYIVELSEIVVIGVLHTRRDPKSWQSRGQG
jgi:plasmid stabilization system protein ParE